MKASFYEELERVFDKCRMYGKVILLGDFNNKRYIYIYNIFTPTIGTESSYETREWT
jgi:hypothetical protein